MAKSIESKISKSLVLSVVMHSVLLSLFLITYSCSTEKTVLVNLQKDPQPQTKPIKAAVVDKSAVDRAVQRQAMEEKLRQQKILDQQQLAEKLRLEAEQARLAVEKAQADKIKIEAATKKAAVEKAAVEKQQQLVKKQQLEQQKIAQQAAQQSLIQKTIEAQKAAKKAADAAAVKAQRDRLQAERQNFLETEVDKFKAEFAAAIEENRILSSVFTGDIRCKIRIRLLPDGSILNVSVLQSSGNSAYDEMSTKAVYKTAPFPMPDDQDLYQQLRDIVLSFRNGEQSNDG